MQPGQGWPLVSDERLALPWEEVITQNFMSQENEIEAEKPSITTDFLPSGGASCSACEELRREVAHLMTEKVKLHTECQKYRVALNRVAHPETWGVNPGHHVEIARRALVIGMKVDPLPEAAKISLPNAEVWDGDPKAPPSR